MMNGFIKPSAWYKRVILLCILLSPALQEVYSMLWSETVFLLLLLIFIVCITRYLRHLTMRSLLISALICATVCLTRYAGVFCLITGGVLIFFNDKPSWRKRIVHCFIFGSISLGPLLINIVRNRWVTGLATGIRPKSEVGLSTILDYFGGVLSDWLLVARNPGLSIVLASGVLLLFAATIVRRKLRKTTESFEYVAAVLGLVYGGFLLVSYSITRYEPFTNRLLAPIFIPLLWTISCWIPGWLLAARRRMKWVAATAVLVAAAWFLNRQLAADWEYYDGVKDAGIPGYREDPFVESGIVQFLEKNQSLFNSDRPVYSNAGDAFYFVTGKPSFQLPFLDFPDQVQRYYDRQRNHLTPDYLVWFQNEEDLQMPALDTILKHKEMVLLKQLPDGAVYMSQ